MVPSGGMATTAVLLIFIVFAPILSYSATLPEQALSNIERDLTDVLYLLLKKVWPIASEVAANGNITVPCTSALFRMFAALKQQEPWLIKMVLANGFVPNNAFEGGVVSLGGYEQCLHTRARGFNGDTQIQGQYCSLFLHPPRQYMEDLVRRFQEQGDLQGRFNPLMSAAVAGNGRQSVRIGICTPASCTATDLSLLASSVLQQFGIQAVVKACRSGNAKAWSGAQVLSVSILSALALLVVVATAIDRWQTERRGSSGKVLSVLLAFSAIANTRALLKTKNTGLNKSLMFLSGLKVLCAYWVLLDHEYIVLQPEFLHSPFELMRLSSKPWFQFIMNGVLSVATFFFMSGFALSFSTTRSQPTLRAFVEAVMRRYIRLTCPMIVTVLAAFLLPLVADGPADSELLSEQLSGCYTTWWALLIHINDFMPLRQMCLNHLWYVAADMQIFVAVALPLAMLLKRNKIVGFAVGALVATSFASLAAAQTYVWRLFHGITFGSNDVRRFSRTLEYIHFKPFVHIPTYVCGTACGFLASTVKEKRLCQGTKVFLWILSAGLACLVMFVTIPWNDGRFPADSVSAIYGGFHRLVWALSLWWPFFACATGDGGFIYRSLAWKALLPLSRLTYGIYLTHVLLHLLRMANTKTPINVDEFLQLRNSIGTFGLSVAMSYALYIICEGPTQQMERMLFRKRTTTVVSDPRRESENGGKPVGETEASAGASK